MTTNDVQGSGDATSGTRRNWARRAMSHWTHIGMGLLVVASTAGSAGLYFGQYRVDQQTGEAAAMAVIAAASDGSAALLSYTPDQLESDLSAAKSHLTGEFLTYYSKFVDEVVEPAARERAIHTTASVARAAVAELHPDSARVLVFLNQTTTTKTAPDPVQVASIVNVSLSKVDAAWLISAFDPI